MLDPTVNCGLAIGAEDAQRRTPAVLLPHSGAWRNRPIAGFVKWAGPEQASKAVLLGNLATLTGGISSASYVAVKNTVNQNRFVRLFSAAAFAHYDAFNPKDLESCLPLTAVHVTDFSLARIGQWRSFIDDSDNLHNFVRDKLTHTVCMFDHNADARPIGIDQVNEALIQHSWRSRNSTESQLAYLRDAQVAAKDIALISETAVRQQAELLHEHGLPVDETFVEDLLARRALFADGPVLIADLARRRNFNLNPGWGKKKHALAP